MAGVTDILTKPISQNIRQLETSIVNTHKKKQETPSYRLRHQMSLPTSQNIIYLQKNHQY